MHHIFFPPRLEVVVLQQDANGLAAYPGNQLALNRFFGHHPYGPARIAWWGIGANHRDDSLAPTRLQQSCRTGPLLVVERWIQPCFQIATTNLTDSLWIQPKIGGHLGSWLTFVQLGKSQGAKNDSNLLDSALEKVIQFGSVPLGQTNMEATIGPHDSV